MKIDWKISNKTLAKAKKVAAYREQGKKWEEIATLMGHHRTYVITLHSFYKKEVAK